MRKQKDDKVQIIGFVSSKHYTQEEKEEMYLKITEFIRTGCPPAKFTTKMYKWLSTHFGHVAHGNKDAFYQAWFATQPRRLDWINYVLAQCIVGCPTATCSDVERAIQKWLSDNYKKLT